MSHATTLEDLIGIEHSKLGFYQELKRKIEELKSSNSELEKKRTEIVALLDGITDLMVVLSEDLRILSVNHIFTEWYPNADAIGHFCYEFFQEKDAPCPNCPALKALDRDEIIRDLCLYKRDDKFRHFDVIASPLKTNPTSQRKVLLFKRDVTREKEFQAQYYQAEKMATVGTLAAGVAHEINNPLTAISGFAEGLQRRLGRIHGKVDEDLYNDFEEYTETIIKECLRCRDIVSSLLSFSRPVDSSFIPVNLNKCINDTLFILKHHLKEQHKVTVSTYLYKDLPDIMGDESQLKQVIINLLTNALDAIGENGTILIRTSLEKDGWVELIVEDSGCGIPMAIQNKLFEFFFTTKPAGKGIGIGLSTCYSIVKHHKGEISVFSEEGKGATFCVLIPEVEK
ncbi:MAG: PAS domain-containing protein [Desulfobulbaceae bacterium]|nr:PAS domain-containing protein [Desulfobulbaceae bacterium]